jgi:alcohol dehydrogenase (cytochrome c)
MHRHTSQSLFSCLPNLLAVGFVLVLLLPEARAQDHASAGKTVFEAQCAACHTTVQGKNGFGPSLAGIVGRKSGSLGDYHYSTAMANANLVWDTKALDEFLTSSTAKVPGTAMSVALSDATQRIDVIAYLGTLGSPPTPPSATKSSATPLPIGPTAQELLHADSDTENWLYASRDFLGQRYSKLAQINAANAKSLRATCIYRANVSGSFQSSPLVYKGILYFTVDNVTVAIDAATCREKWTSTWEMKATPLSKTNRGVAIQDGRVVRGTPDGFLIALNMADGSVLWSQKIADPAKSQYLSMPPLIIDDMIIYGPAGADWGEKGWIGAFRLQTGEPMWKFNLIPDANEPGADSWKDAASREHGGASQWTPLAYDAKTKLLYVPVGNPAPDFFGDARPGDNLYTNSLVVLDAPSGALRWYKQFGPNDVNDRDLSQVSPLYSAPVNGKVRDLIAISGKDGLLRVLDRASHEQLFELAITTRTGVAEKPTEAGVHGCPGLLGGMEWNGPAYSPISNALYVATVDWCGTFTRQAVAPPFTTNAHYYGGAVTPDPREQARGWLYAVDATTGAVRWHEQWPTPLVAGVTATAGGVLFTGDLDNQFLTIDASNGKTLYSMNTGGTVGGGVLTYAVKGKQYVATTSGVVSGFFGGSGAAAIVVFSLP